MAIKSNTTDFIKKAIKIHSDTYDYSLVIYQTARIKIKIVCKIHGTFKQTPFNHLSGHGCVLCARDKRHYYKRGPYKSITKTKICNQCKNEFPRTNKYFNNNNKTYDKLSTLCKFCLSEKHKKWVMENRDKVNKIHKTWLNNNKEKYNKIRNKSVKNRYDSDINYKLLINIRSRIYIAINHQFIKKTNKTIKLLGCSIPFLKEYLESQFIDGMSWDNYGRNGWEIDHIQPCASFDFTDIDQQRRCFHYTNLQPLWKKDNILKGDSYNGTICSNNINF